MRRRRATALVLALGLVSASGGGCKKKNEAQPTTPPADANGKKEAPAPAPVPEPAPTLTIRLSARTGANDLRPFYVVVRAVTRKEFVEDQYQAVAALVIAPDESVLASVLVFPGTDQQLTIAKPEGKTLGVYALLTNATGTSWKRLFEEPKAIAVVVERDSMSTMQ